MSLQHCNWKASLGSRPGSLQFFLSGMLGWRVYCQILWWHEGVCDSMREKMILKRVGERMQPCFTLLQIGNGFDDDLWKCTAPYIPLKKEVMELSSYSWKSPLLLTRSNALVKLMEAICRSCLCSLLFCSCLREKIMSVVDLSALKLHRESGYTCLARIFSLFRAIQK